MFLYLLKAVAAAPFFIKYDHNIYEDALKIYNNF
jgi:hypothetical protein